MSGPMIDCHNHTLPGIDDGARDMEYALCMAQGAVTAGITTIIVTPHHLNGVYVNPKKQILNAIMEFQTAITAADIPLRIYPGSELHLVPELPTQLREGEALTYADMGKAALVELPKRTIPTGSERILEQLLYQGITPVIAHPERNATLASHPERAADWVSWGCKLQLTAQSCAGDFGQAIQAVCRRWCQEGLVHLIASDAHRIERRPPDLRAGADVVEKWLGQKAVDLFTRINPQRLIDGVDLLDLQADELRPPPRKRSRKHHWLRQLTGL